MANGSRIIITKPECYLKEINKILGKKRYAVNWYFISLIKVFYSIVSVVYFYLLGCLIFLPSLLPFVLLETWHRFSFGQWHKSVIIPLWLVDSSSSAFCVLGLFLISDLNRLTYSCQSIILYLIKSFRNASLGANSKFGFPDFLPFHQSS